MGKKSRQKKRRRQERVDALLREMNGWSVEEQILSGNPALEERCSGIFDNTKRYLAVLRMPHSTPSESPSVDRLLVEHMVMSFDRACEHFTVAVNALMMRNVATAAVIIRALFEEYVTTAFLIANPEYVPGLLKNTVQQQLALARAEAQFPRSKRPDYQATADKRADNFQFILDRLGIAFPDKQPTLPGMKDRIQALMSDEQPGEHHRVYRMFYQELSEYVHPAWGGEPDPVRLAGFAVIAQFSLILSISSAGNINNPWVAAIGRELDSEARELLDAVVSDRPLHDSSLDDDPCALGHRGQAVAAMLGLQPTRCTKCGDTPDFQFAGVSPGFPDAPEVGLPEFASDEWVRVHSDPDLGIGYVLINDEEFGQVRAVYIDQWELEEEWDLLSDADVDAETPFVKPPVEERWQLFEFQLPYAEPVSPDAFMPSHREAWSEDIFGTATRMAHITTTPGDAQPLETLICENPHQYGQILWHYANDDGFDVQADTPVTITGSCPDHGWHEYRYYPTAATIQNATKFAGVGTCGEVSDAVASWIWPGR